MDRIAVRSGPVRRHRHRSASLGLLETLQQVPQLAVALLPEHLAQEVRAFREGDALSRGLGPRIPDEQEILANAVDVRDRFFFLGKFLKCGRELDYLSSIAQHTKVRNGTGRSGG